MFPTLMIMVERFFEMTFDKSHTICFQEFLFLHLLIHLNKRFAKLAVYNLAFSTSVFSIIPSIIEGNPKRNARQISVYSLIALVIDKYCMIDISSLNILNRFNNHDR